MSNPEGTELVESVKMRSIHSLYWLKFTQIEVKYIICVSGPIARLGRAWIICAKGCGFEQLIVASLPSHLSKFRKYIQT